MSPAASAAASMALQISNNTIWHTILCLYDTPNVQLSFEPQEYFQLSLVLPNGVRQLGLSVLGLAEMRHV